MNSLQSDIKRAITSWGFIAGLIGIWAAIFFDSFDTILPFLQNRLGGSLATGFHEQILLSALSSTLMMLCIPILSTLPYTTATVEDTKADIKNHSPL